MTVTNIDNSSGLANDLYTALTAGVNFPAAPDFSEDKFTFDPDPNSVLYQDIDPVDLESITNGCIDGPGAFDKMMAAVDAHLDKEFKGGRITGAQYSEVYKGVMSQVLSNATSFALQKDQSKWAAIQAQMQARTAEIQATIALIELERAKFDTTKSLFDMNLTAAQYAATKMGIATEEANHDGVTIQNAMRTYELEHLLPADRAIKEYERSYVMPSTVAMNNVQSDRILPAQAAISEFQNRELQPLEKAIQELTLNRIMESEAQKAEFEVTNILPLKLAQEQHNTQIRQPLESELIEEQIEVQHAQTQDLRRDGTTPVEGVIGLQKDNLDVEERTKEYQLTNLVPKQVELTNYQVTLTREQGESERAKTLDTRSDAQAVVGSVGKQKDLYDEQILSFRKDAKHKVAKMYLDSWITQKTLDEGLNAPTQLTNNEINEVMASVRAYNDMGS